ncbi:ArsR/SmtB family transcription factor [Treponema parvum]|uniref:ArsR/SmtB family transcription factor n=1 Tax=Treponema parvum TaxID=138851 RepID=UPI001AEC3A6F|nr:metalloregulator ArsR/SmtB family transcription factor [Treponema parvum]QTQ16020.1 winged helix-turn-helix transcriptional regulator [Treponema parvum]
MDIEKIYNAFREEIPVFTAFSDDERFKLFLRILQAGETGIHVNAVKALSHLSRPAVSHHLKILKTSGLIDFRKSGTKIYYYVSCKDKFSKLKKNLSILAQGIQDTDLEEIASSDEIKGILDSDK